MTNVATPNPLKLAIQHHQAGRLAEAEAIYREILARTPEHADAMHLLGVVCHQTGRNEAALLQIATAVSLKPNVPDYYCNMGVVLAELKRFNEAVAAQRKALSLKPDYPDALNNLGAGLSKSGKLDEAISAYQLSLELRPSRPEPHVNLAEVWLKKYDFTRALEAADEAIKLSPDFAEAHNTRGCALKDLKRLDDAIAAFTRAMELNPRSPEALCNLGDVYLIKKDYARAIELLRAALKIKPEFPMAIYRLASAMQDDGQLDQAIHFFRQALILEPDWSIVHERLGGALCDAGLKDEGIAEYRKAADLEPDNEVYYSNLLYALYQHHGVSAAQLREDHRIWSERFADPVRHLILPHGNDRSTRRKLRVGYVSADFKDHPAGWNILPLLQNHDHDKFEIFGYCGVEIPDRVTELVMSYTDGWRGSWDKDDAALANQIRQDKIDILVDLSLHTGGNRLRMFARKPAPVQICYLGHCGTTGLEQMDYRISDPYLDPPGVDESLYTEQTIRLPHSYWCYYPGDWTPAVNELSARTTGHVTFASLNVFAKVSPDALETWARILEAVPDSHLMIHTRPGPHLWDLQARFIRHGISADRLEFVNRYSRQNYMQIYHHVDISLDPFRYGGGITTCDSLWMGVPVVTMPAEIAVGRTSASVLSNVGMPEMIAKTPDEYVAIAVNLATDQDRLAKIRAGLREQTRASKLMDAKGFARDMEEIYRTVWRKWAVG